MGLRGPLPTPAHLRAVRGNTRKRRNAAGLKPAIARLLHRRAEELERLGYKLLKRAEGKPTVKTPANGEAANPLFGEARKCFAEVDRIQMRLGRLEPEARLMGEESQAADADPLEAFRRAKH